MTIRTGQQAPPRKENRPMTTTIPPTHKVIIVSRKDRKIKVQLTVSSTDAMLSGTAYSTDAKNMWDRLKNAPSGTFEVYIDTIAGPVNIGEMYSEGMVNELNKIERGATFSFYVNPEITDYTGYAIGVHDLEQ